MQDTEFLSQFENCTLPAANFKHIDHIRLTWIYLQKFPLADAMIKVTEGIKRYATHHGVAHIYDENLTRDWVMRIHEALQQNPSCPFEEFLQLNPQFMRRP